MPFQLIKTIKGQGLGLLYAHGRLEEQPEDSMKMGLVNLYGVAFVATKPVCLELLLVFVYYACISKFYCISLILPMK